MSNIDKMCPKGNLYYCIAYVINKEESPTLYSILRNQKMKSKLNSK